MKFILPLAICMTFSGCAAQGAWQKNGATRDNVTTELSDCRYQVGISKAAPSAQTGLINDCMQGKGFRYR